MSKLFVFLLEVLLSSIVLPLMNYNNQLHQNKYRLKLHKFIINDDENENNLDYDLNDDENENNFNLNDELLSDDSYDIKLNDFTFIDDKLD
jgi:hemolysin activation/secretion protein